MPTKILNVQGQDYTPLEFECSGHPEYGGAATVRMILLSDKVKSKQNPANSIATDPSCDQQQGNQKTMYDYASARNDANEGGVWFIDPGALRQTLMDKTTHPPYFVDDSNSNLDVVNSVIVSTIQNPNYEVAPAVLTAASKQWLCVTGYVTDQSGTLAGFYLNDPSDANAPQFNGVTPYAWNTIYMSSAVEYGVRWKGKYVAICDPDAPKTPISSLPRRIKLAGDRIVKPDEAVHLAREAISEQGWQEQRAFGQALASGVPSSAQLVEYLGARDTYYYVVSFGAPGKVYARVAIDARYGDLWMASASADGLRLPVLEPGSVAQLITRRPIELHDRLEDIRNDIIDELHGAGRVGPGNTFTRLRDAIDRHIARIVQPETVALRPEAVHVLPTLAWRPSLWGASPLRPYYVATTARYRFFVRWDDGEIIPEPWWRFQRQGG